MGGASSTTYVHVCTASILRARQSQPAPPMSQVSTQPRDDDGKSTVDTMHISALRWGAT
jgi:hypothetical protein